MELVNITNDVSVLKAEILLYKQQTASNIIEIGKRLLEVKEMLPHGSFGKWVESEVQFSHITANRFMRVASEISNSSSMINLEQTKIFALLSLPSEDREAFILENSPEDMTVKELQEAIKAKKYAEEKAKEIMRELEEERKENNGLRQANDSLLLTKQQVQVIEIKKEVHVIPEDYDLIKKQASSRDQWMDHAGKLEKKLKESNEEILALQREKERSQPDEVSNSISILSFINSMASFAQDNSHYLYQGESFKQMSEKERSSCLIALDNVDDFLYKLKTTIKDSTNFVEVDFNE